jgi:dienelactone hydrolase
MRTTVTGQDAGTDVTIEGPVSLAGNLVVPADARGIVLFVHGSGSSRFSSRNRYVARVLQEAGLATLLFDLLTEEEEVFDEETAQLRFDIPLLVGRLLSAIRWAAADARTRELAIGCFGASTGAAAALIAAAKEPDAVHAVVSRGGRPDLAGASLADVKAPVLLIVGARDSQVIELNEEALDQLRCEKKLEIVADATHLFEEPGALERVAALARDWFWRHLHASAAGHVAEGAAP